MNDTQLIKLAQQGAPDAIAQLYDKYAEAIFRYCYWQINRNREEAEDLTHDVFIEMAKSIKNFKGEGSFKNWLYTIAKRQVNKWVKQKYDASFSPLYDNIVEEEIEVDEGEQRQKANLLDSLIDQLKPRAQQILKLRFLRNYTVSETALAVGVSEANVKVITHRSLKRLQGIAAGYDNYDFS